MLRLKTTGIGPRPMYNHFCPHCVYIMTMPYGERPPYDIYLCEVEQEDKGGSVVLRHGEHPGDVMSINVNDVDTKLPSLNAISNDATYHLVLAARTALESAWRRGFMTRE